MAHTHPNPRAYPPGVGKHNGLRGGQVSQIDALQREFSPNYTLVETAIQSLH